MVWLFVVVLFADGLLAGLSVDKVIVQLPARRRLGVVAYADYARAADLGGGLALYPIVGIGAAVLTIIAFPVALFSGATGATVVLLGIAGLLSLLHSVATGFAVPTMMRIGRSPNDEAVLTPLLSRFALASGIRAILQVTTFVIVLIAVALS